MHLQRRDPDSIQGAAGIVTPVRVKLIAGGNECCNRRTRFAAAGKYP